MGSVRALSPCLALLLTAGCGPGQATTIAPDGGRAGSSGDAAAAGPVDEGGVEVDATAPGDDDGGPPADGLSGVDGAPADDGGARTPLAADASGDASDPSRGLQLITVDTLGVWIYLPQSMTASDKAPVIFSLHGLDIPAPAMADITGLPAVAEREHLVAIFPSGSGGTWNTGGATCGLGAFAGNSNDDGKYMDDILAAVEKVQAIDHARIFMSGFSMGGYATHNLACARPDLARAAAAASGGRTPQTCAMKPEPIIIFHGTSDGTIAYQCGVDARDAWALHNGCSTTVTTMTVMGGHCDYSQGCPSGGEVVLCSFQGMGHGWAGSNDPFALGGSQYESATSLMMMFFKAHM
jgi:poly(3-hydroxybutyrate) depolymerase